MKESELSPARREAILKRYTYRCDVCQVDVGLQIHPWKPDKRTRGKFRLEDWRVLCEQHSSLKETYGQVEVGKRMFIGLLRASAAYEDEAVVAFATEVLAVYEKYGIDTHIKWKKKI